MTRLLLICLLVLGLNSRAFADFEADRNLLVSTPLFFNASSEEEFANFGRVLDLLKRLQTDTLTETQIVVYYYLLSEKTWSRRDGESIDRVFVTDIRNPRADVTKIPDGQVFAMAYQLYTSALVLKLSDEKLALNTNGRGLDTMAQMLTRHSNFIKEHMERLSANSERMLWNAMVAALESSIARGLKEPLMNDYIFSPLARAIIRATNIGSKIIGSNLVGMSLSHQTPEEIDTLDKEESTYFDIEFLRLAAMFSRGDADWILQIEQVYPEQPRGSQQLLSSMRLAHVFFANSSNDVLSKHHTRMGQILGFLSPWIYGYATMMADSDLFAAIRRVSEDPKPEVAYPVLSKDVNLEVNSNFPYDPTLSDDAEKVLAAVTTFTEQSIAFRERNRVIYPNMEVDIEKVLGKSWSSNVPHQVRPIVENVLNTDNHSFGPENDRIIAFKVIYSLNALGLAYTYVGDLNIPAFEQFTTREMDSFYGVLQLLQSGKLDDQLSLRILDAVLRALEPAVLRRSNQDRPKFPDSFSMAFTLSNFLKYIDSVLKERRFSADEHEVKRHYENAFVRILLLAAKYVRDPSGSFNRLLLVGYDPILDSKETFVDQLLVSRSFESTPEIRVLQKETIEAARPWIVTHALAAENDDLVAMIADLSPSTKLGMSMVSDLCGNLWGNSRLVVKP